MKEPYRKGESESILAPSLAAGMIIGLLTQRNLDEAARFAGISLATLRRQPSTARAVCVNALVRICAGGDQRWSSLPRQ